MVDEPFNPRGFLHLAEQLVQYDPTEAQYRTAIGRSYYAMLHVLLAKVKVKGGRGVHARLARTLLKQNRPVGEQLATLRRLRDIADYQLWPMETTDRNWRENWEQAQLAVRRLEKKIQWM
jgi:uncharacterized protein (UPF0332 family)